MTHRHSLCTRVHVRARAAAMIPHQAHASDDPQVLVCSSCCGPAAARRCTAPPCPLPMQNPGTHQKAMLHMTAIAPVGRPVIVAHTSCGTSATMLIEVSQAYAVKPRPVHDTFLSANLRMLRKNQETGTDSSPTCLGQKGAGAELAMRSIPLTAERWRPQCL